MLVNVSRFVRVQEQVSALLEIYTAQLKNAIEFHSFSYADGSPNAHIGALEATFNAHYADCGSEWSAVLDLLHESIRLIKVRTYNARSTTNGDAAGSEPTRTIAVGGDVLSRGVTLDGLMISYFYRRSAASDTLMQMARWFGYRDGYLHLCRLWIDPEVAGQFRYINESVEELRRDLKTMRLSNLTPKDFGLAVREHPDSLLITARNKMRAASSAVQSVSLFGRSVEAVQLTTEPKVRKANEEATVSLLRGAIQGRADDIGLEIDRKSVV